MIPASVYIPTAGPPSLPLPYAATEPCPELATVIKAWPSLPDAVRAGILAMVNAASPDVGKNSVGHRRSRGPRKNNR